MHFSTWLYPLWEPLSPLDLVGSEFCFIWLCKEIFVQWRFLWNKVPLQFCMSDYGLVTVAWDSSKICLFCTVGIEAVLYDCYESACMMSLLWWLENIRSCVSYDLACLYVAVSTLHMLCCSRYTSHVMLHVNWCCIECKWNLFYCQSVCQLSIYCMNCINIISKVPVHLSL
jgi:hypothetical protein